MVGIGAAAALALFAGARLLQPRIPEEPWRSAPRGDESDVAGFVGDRACKPCHQIESNQHVQSAHALTLREMNRETLGSLSPPTGKIAGTPYSFVEDGGRYFFEIDVPGKYQFWPLDYCFGSGKTGLTFVSMLEGANVVAMKMSWFPHDRIWRTTPGQDQLEAAAAGNLGNLEQSRSCLGCHISAMSENVTTPRPEHVGVGCESCHGAGREHIQAAERKEKDLKMAHLRDLGAQGLNTLCARCHQSKKVGVDPEFTKMTFRFQPYGIMKSRCFQEGGRTLSCLTCHQPHTDVSTDAESYVSTCLSCHSGNPLPAGSQSKAGKKCPVRPSSGCIGCHMPPRDVLSVSKGKFGMTMTEHLIKVYPAATAARTTMR